MNPEIEYRGYRIVQMPAREMAPFLKCSEEEAPQRLCIDGMRFHHVYVVLDEFDDPAIPGCSWFEAPLTAKAAVDIHCYGEGFQRAFWPNYHDVYIAMRSCPQILRALQELHQDAVRECDGNDFAEPGDFAFRARERLARCFTEMETQLTRRKEG